MTETTDVTASAVVKMERAPGRALAGKIATSDLADELLERARADGTSLVGPGGLLTRLTRRPECWAGGCGDPSSPTRPGRRERLADRRSQAAERRR